MLRNYINVHIQVSPKKNTTIRITSKSYQVLPLRLDSPQTINIAASSTVIDEATYYTLHRILNTNLVFTGI